jgi:hypothetical protein
MQLFSVENAAPQIHNPELGVRRVQIDGVWFFSILDIFKLYGDTSNPTVEWAKVEAFLIKQGAIDPLWQAGGSMKTVELRTHQFEGKGQRKTPIATFKMVMRIAQATTFKEWEAARDEMAGLAKERVEEIHNPELGVDRARQQYISKKMREGMSESDALRSYAALIDSKAARNDLTSALKESAIVPPTGQQYSEATNIEYEGLFGMRAKRITELTGVSPAKHGLTEEGRQTLMLADTMIARKFREQGKMSFDEQARVVREVARIYGASVKEIEQLLGVSLVTGKPLLTGGRQ